MKLIYIVIITVSHLTLNNAQIITCNDEGRDTLDINIQKTYLFGSPDRKYPTNNNEMKTFCEENFQINSRIKEYKDKCLDNLSKQVVGLLTYSTNFTIANVCKSQRKSKEFIKWSRCGNTAKTGTIKCWNQLTHHYEGVKLLKENKLKLPLLCCNFYLFKSCNIEVYEKNGRACNQASIDGLDHLLDKFVLEVLAALCGDYVFESDKCDKIIGLTPTPTIQVTRHSPILQFIDVLNSIPLN